MTDRNERAADAIRRREERERLAAIPSAEAMVEAAVEEAKNGNAPPTRGPDLTIHTPGPGQAHGEINVNGYNDGIVKGIRLAIATANGVTLLDLPVLDGPEGDDLASKVAAAILDLRRQMASGIIRAR